MVNAKGTWLVGQGKSATEVPRANDLESLSITPKLQLSWDVGVALPAPANSAISARSIRTSAQLGKLKEIWGLAQSGSESPMNGYEWTRISAEVFNSQEALEVIVAGSPPSFAIAPLLRTNVISKRLELIGATSLAEPTDFVYSSPAACGALARAVAKLRLPLFLPRVPANSPLVTALRVAFRNSGLVICRAENGTPWISLDESWTSPERHLNAGRRSDLRRARRRAERFGETYCKVLSPTPEELGPLLEEAFRVEMESWKGRERTALAFDAKRGEFYRRYAHAAAAMGILRLCFLYIGRRAAAMQFAVEAGGRFWLLKIGYADEFARCSPGNLLVMETIQYAAHAGLTSYEFLGQADPWIEMWTSDVRPCNSVRVYPFNGLGAIALATDAAAKLRRQAKSIMGGRP